MPLRGTSAGRPSLSVKFDHRPATAPMGRFGGGWQWKLGFQASNLSRRRGTVILNLLVLSVRIVWG